jgi:acyl carrier protein
MRLTESDIATVVRAYVQENLLYAAPSNFVLEEDDSLIERGVIDSMGVLEVLAFLEQTFDIAIDDNEVTTQNLGSLRSIARFVAAKKANLSVTTTP